MKHDAAHFVEMIDEHDPRRADAENETKGSDSMSNNPLMRMDYVEKLRANEPLTAETASAIASEMEALARDLGECRRLVVALRESQSATLPKLKAHADAWALLIREAEKSENWWTQEAAEAMKELAAYARSIAPEVSK